MSQLQQQTKVNGVGFDIDMDIAIYYTENNETGSTVLGPKTRLLDANG